MLNNKQDLSVSSWIKKGEYDIKKLQNKPFSLVIVSNDLILEEQMGIYCAEMLNLPLRERKLIQQEKDLLKESEYTIGNCDHYAPSSEFMSSFSGQKSNAEIAHKIIHDIEDLSINEGGVFLGYMALYALNKKPNHWDIRISFTGDETPTDVKEFYNHAFGFDIDDFNSYDIVLKDNPDHHLSAMNILKDVISRECEEIKSGFLKTG